MSGQSHSSNPSTPLGFDSSGFLNPQPQIVYIYLDLDLFEGLFWSRTTRMILGVSEDGDSQGLQMVPDYILGLAGKKKVLGNSSQHAHGKVRCAMLFSYPSVR